MARGSARARIVSAVRFATTTVKVLRKRFSGCAVAWMLFCTALQRKFFSATFNATGSLSSAHTLPAPSRTRAIARIPDPVPTSSAANCFLPWDRLTRSIDAVRERFGERAITRARFLRWLALGAVAGLAPRSAAAQPAYDFWFTRLR